MSRGAGIARGWTRPGFAGLALWALLLLLPATSWAGGAVLGWTMDFHTAAGLGCARIEQALALADDQWVSGDELPGSATGLRGHSLWVRLQPQEPRSPAWLVVQWKHNATLNDWRDTTQRQIRHSRGHAPGFTVVSLPGTRNDPLLLCLLAPTLRADLFSILSPQQLQAAERRVILTVSLLSGMILASAAIGLAFFLRQRRAVFLAFALFCASMLGWLLAHLGALQGLLSPMIDPRGPISYTLTLSLGAIATMTAVHFIAPFIGLTESSPRTVRLLHRLAALAVLGAALALLQMRPFDINNVLIVAGLLVHNVSIGLILCLSIALAVAAARRGHRESRLFLAGWTPLILLLLVEVLVIMGSLPPARAPSPPLMLAATAFASLLLGWSLVDRARRDRIERDEALARASRDPLTGASSRAALRPLLEATGPGDLLLYLDIDHFKQINDRHGHGVGDRCLQRFAQRCHEQLRGVDRLGRYGGEEFLALLPGCDIEEGLRVAERIRAAVARPAEGEPDFTVSIGLAARRAAESTHEWIERADEALYQAKAQGRNRVVLADAMPPDAEHDGLLPQQV